MARKKTSPASAFDRAVYELILQADELGLDPKASAWNDIAKALREVRPLVRALAVNGE